jgi:D-serine deaminase-like pyridoxal phosphate-dependent protein
MKIKSFENIETPGVIVFPEIVKKNIDWIIHTIGSTSRLRPHIKTHKTKEVNEMLLASGITKFKAATIAEAELLALSEAPDVLISMQLIGPNLSRFIQLVTKYPKTQFSCLCDDASVLASYQDAASQAAITLSIYIDLNVGMNRTGIQPENALGLLEEIKKSDRIHLKGIHAYDGHIRDKAIEDRKNHVAKDFTHFWNFKKVVDAQFKDLEYVVGGTPSFLVHFAEEQFTCSPGTFVFTDAGYQALYPENSLEQAVFIVSRIISKPTKHTICLDMGHKSVAPENSIENRVRFLFNPDFKLLSQSEEHGIVEVGDSSKYAIGDVIVMQPYHVCPTINLTQKLQVIENGNKNAEWEVVARNRSITI